MTEPEAPESLPSEPLNTVERIQEVRERLGERMLVAGKVSYADTEILRAVCFALDCLEENARPAPTFEPAEPRGELRKQCTGLVEGDETDEQYCERVMPKKKGADV